MIVASIPSQDRRGQIQNAVSIERRTAGANNRSRLGHWERDTMVGGERKTGVLVCVERKSRYTRLAKLPRKTADRTAKATVKLLKHLPCKSITNDRGQEFQAHERVADKLGVSRGRCGNFRSGNVSKILWGTRFQIEWLDNINRSNT
ncbi:MAG: IS30 family transposase [Candidatus Competibacteraceae bacterium]|nr:IS30 family transposase [Candidatus Competibacteraceae bacterium]